MPTASEDGASTERQAPKVSVCIPTYNRKDYLRETIASVFQQTFKDFEIVVVDDGSTDGTAEMVARMDCPITYFHQSNSGDAAAPNKLIELAKGQYISFLDSDDCFLLMPSKEWFAQPRRRMTTSLGTAPISV